MNELQSSVWVHCPLDRNFPLYKVTLIVWLTVIPRSYPFTVSIIFAIISVDTSQSEPVGQNYNAQATLHMYSVGVTFVSLVYKYAKLQS